jgi:hypothetical protein
MPSVSKPARAERMDADILFAAAYALDQIVLKLAPDARARLFEDRLLRRARAMLEMVKQEQGTNEPMLLRTVWRSDEQPPLVHWLVGGIATVGECGLFEDTDFAACGSETYGIYVGDDTTWERGTMDEQPATCLKCLALLQAAGSGNPGRSS